MPFSQLDSQSPPSRATQILKDVRTEHVTRRHQVRVQYSRSITQISLSYSEIVRYASRRRGRDRGVLPSRWFPDGSVRSRSFHIVDR